MTDWSPLFGSWAPPVPGNPDAIAGASASLRQLAGELANRHADLESVTLPPAWTGIADTDFVATFTAIRQSLPPILDALAVGADALSSCEATLRIAQDRALAALYRAIDGQHMVDRARSGRARSGPHEDTSWCDRLEEEGRRTIEQARNAAQQSQNDAQEAISSCLASLERVTEGLTPRHAFATAATFVEASVDPLSLPSDRTLEVVSDVCGTLSTILGAAALLLALYGATAAVTGVGLPLTAGAAAGTEILGKVSVPLDALKLDADVHLAEHHARSWAPVGEDSVALGIDLVGGGGGAFRKTAVVAGHALTVRALWNAAGIRFPLAASTFRPVELPATSFASTAVTARQLKAMVEELRVEDVTYPVDAQAIHATPVSRHLDPNADLPLADDINRLIRMSPASWHTSATAVRQIEVDLPQAALPISTSQNAPWGPLLEHSASLMKGVAGAGDPSTLGWTLLAPLLKIEYGPPPPSGPSTRG